MSAELSGKPLATTVEPASLYVSQPDGTRIHVRVCGEGRRSCLLIHGFGDGAFVWNAFAAALAPMFRSFAVDLRGHGESDWDPGAQYHMTTHIADLLHVIDSLELQPLVVVGHSLGAALAVRLANAMCGRVTDLIVVDYGPDIPEQPRQHARSQFREQLCVYASHDDYVEWLAPRRPLMQPQVRAQVARSALRARGEGESGYVLKCDPALADVPDDEVLDRNRWLQLSLLSCRVLIVRGAGSAYLSRRDALRMVSMIPDASLEEVPLAGHAVVLDNPSGFLRATQRFLRDVAPTLTMR